MMEREGDGKKAVFIPRQFITSAKSFFAKEKTK